MRGPLGRIVDSFRAEAYARRKLSEMGVTLKSTEWSRLFEKGLEGYRATEVPTDPYTQIADVYACVRAIATQAASVEFGVFKADEPVEDHEAVLLFEHANEHVVGSEFIDTTFVYLETCGEVFWYLDEFARSSVRGPEAPRAIYFLHPREMTEKLDRGGKLVGWKWQHPTRGLREFTTDEVFHLGYPNPNDPIRGLSPLSAAMPDINLIFKALSWQQKFFQNGGLPPFFVSFPKDVDLQQDQIAVLKAEFRNEYLGQRNAGRVPFLFRGGELKTVGPSQKEMDWLETTKHAGDKIGAVYGVPPVYRGIYLANFAIREQKRLMLYETVFPKLHFLETGVQSGFIERFWPGVEWRFDVKAKAAQTIPEDVQDAAKAVRELWSMGVPFKEAARVMGLEVDTADMPWLEVGYLPFNLMPAESLTGEQVAAVPAAAKGRFPARLRKPEQRGAYKRGLEVLWEGIARAYRLRYQSWLYDQRTVTLAALDAAGGKSLRLVGPVQKDLDADTVMFDLDEAAGELVRVSRPAWESGLKTGGKSVIDELGLGDPFSMDAPEALKFLSGKAMKIKVDHQIVGAVHDAVRAAIQAGIDAGENIQDIKDRVRDAFNVERARSLTIARTEVGQSFAGGRFIEMGQEGVKRHQWLTAGDDEVRDSHEGMEGETVDLGEPFSNGLLYPLQADSDKPEEVINCRCAAVSVMG